MSIVATYARLPASEVGGLQSNPESFWELDVMNKGVESEERKSASESLYLDKGWQLLSWLCSDLGRMEAIHNAAIHHVDFDIEDPEKFKSAIRIAAKNMGLEYTDPSDFSVDPVLLAIQGAREDGDGLVIPELGYGATVFDWDKVKKLNTALNKVTQSSIRARFNVVEMEALYMPGDWVETELEEFLLPQFQRLKELYNRAEVAEQSVVVVLS